MKFPFFASFLVFCALIFYENRKSSRKSEKLKKSYWDRELEANSTRKKPLDDLEYLHIDIDALPINTAKDDVRIAESINDILSLANEEIVNFTGLTNTDLKLKYGVANLPYLQKCDMNFTTFARILNEWCHRLLELGYEDEALLVAEYAINNNSDASTTFYLAADIYKKRDEEYKINLLIEKAESLNSAFKNILINNLKEKLT